MRQVAERAQDTATNDTVPGKTDERRGGMVGALLAMIRVINCGMAKSI